MQHINRGDGTGTGDSVKQALRKTADNFLELDTEVQDLRRLVPRLLKGQGKPAYGFPQQPSPKGSPWTGAVRKGQLTFNAASTLVAERIGILPLPSGKIVVASAPIGSGTAANVTLQLASVSGTGALAAIGIPQVLPTNSTTLISMAPIGVDLFIVHYAQTSGSYSSYRAVCAATADGISVLSNDNVAGGARQSTGCRALRTETGIASPYYRHTGGGFGLKLLGAPAVARDYDVSSTAGGFPGHDLIDADAAVIFGNITDPSGAIVAAAVLVHATDLAAVAASYLTVSAASASSPSVVALSASLVVAQPTLGIGAIALGIVDNQLQRIGGSVQIAGVLGRTWRATAQQDGERFLVFEQSGDLVAPTVVEVDPVTGAFVERGTVPVLFGTSGHVRDAVKIGPNRVLVAGRASSASANIGLECWDLS